MSHTPEHATEHRSDRPLRGHETVSGGNSLGLSVVLFVVLFALFLVGLYLMSLFTPVMFIAGLVLVLASLFGAFTVVPAALT